MQTKNVSIGKKRQISGRVLINLGGLILIGSAGAKFAHVPAVVSQPGAMGFDGSGLAFIAGSRRGVRCFSFLLSHDLWVYSSCPRTSAERLPAIFNTASQLFSQCLCFV